MTVLTRKANLDETVRKHCFSWSIQKTLLCNLYHRFSKYGSRPIASPGNLLDMQISQAPSLSGVQQSVLTSHLGDSDAHPKAVSTVPRIDQRCAV
jgi:hypothetical protein